MCFADNSHASFQDNTKSRCYIGVTKVLPP